VVITAAGTDAFRPGDEVVALADGAFASEVTTKANLVFPKPARLSFEEAATTPAAFVTAHYALCQLARITAGERVLIHTASGGVGLAAIQVCRRAGAVIFATAGTPEKREYLRSIGIEHVMDSRSLTFADEVLETTHGEGIDVILNSLTGEARDRGLELLRTSGRFVDMAVRDLMNNVPLFLRPFEKGLSYFTLGDMKPAERPALAATLKTIVEELAAGRLEPLPRTDFDIGDAEQAIRLMAQAGHIGKIVLTVGKPSYAVEPAKPSIVRPDATYMITGGLGGFGLAVAKWLVRRGARHIVLLSRSGASKEEDRASFDALMRSDAEIIVRRADVADVAQITDVLETIRAAAPPLRGVIHAAMTLDDDVLGRLTPDRLRSVLAPKVAGAWNLHTLTRQDELDFFVLFSSGSSLIGVPSQGNYAAANAFLDALALHRRAQGLPCLSINWGAIKDAGYVARHAELQSRLAWEGIESITADEACDALDLALRRNMGRVAVARIDWNRWSNGTTQTYSVGQPQSPEATEGDVMKKDRLIALLRNSATPAERQAIIEQHLVQYAARVLEARTDRVDPMRALTEMGMDSLMAVEMQTALRRDLGVEPSLIEILGGGTIRNLAAGLLEQMPLP
jgi:NADPH:quinone reductase-like Zn-dependent oxidoreductase/acyl carrier protein